MSTFLVNSTRFHFDYTANSILFESNGTFVVPTDNPLTMVAIGGGGGGIVSVNAYRHGAGGGGGNLRWSNNIVLPKGTVLNITVGGQGWGWANGGGATYGTSLGNAGGTPPHTIATAGGYSSIVRDDTSSTLLLASGGHGWASWSASGTTTNGTRTASNGTSTATGSRTVDSITYTVSGGNGGNGAIGQAYNSKNGVAAGGAAGGGGAGGYTGKGGDGGQANDSVGYAGSHGLGGGSGGGLGVRLTFNAYFSSGGGTVIFGPGANGVGGNTSTGTALPRGGDGSSSDVDAMNSPNHDNYAYGWGGSGSSYYYQSSIHGGQGAVWIRWTI